MLEHYSYIRMDAKRNALNALTTKQELRFDSRDTTRVCDTNDDTIRAERVIPSPQMVDSLVELSGIEPLTSSLRTRRSPS